MKIKAKKILLILIIVVAAGIYFGYDFLSPEPQKTSYADFILNMENHQIEKVQIGEKDIVYTLKENTDKKKFSVTNPNSPDIAERLLLSGADVSVTKSASETFSLVFDLIFYAVFAFIFIFVFRRFISPNSYKIIRHTGTSFDDIIGMENLKKSMMQIADMMKHPAEYKKRGMRMPKGILMEGAPGNGKTMFARALANEAGINFIPAKATDFESMFMAIGPMKVKMLFRKARRNAPCIVFIDEFDGIGTKRNYSGSAIETENTRIVTALLNELDGFTVNDGVLVIAATNSRQALDEALVRPGRFDAKYMVPYPEKKDRIRLIKKYTENKKLDSSVDIEKLAELFSSFSCAHIESVINRSAFFSRQNENQFITMDDIKDALKEL